MKGYFAYTSLSSAFTVNVRLEDKGPYYFIDYVETWGASVRPPRPHLPEGCLWYLELEDGMVLVDFGQTVSRGVVLEPSLESILL